ncbi:MAG: SMC family ATPase, partial [Methylococcales bacterium]|nr:SMC family ATPase [Methylococcales bacterium]
RTRLEQKQQALTATAKRVETATELQTTLTQAEKESQSRLKQLEHSLAELSKQIEQHHAERATLQQMVGERKLWTQELNQLQVQSKQVTGLTSEKTTVRQQVETAQSKLETLVSQSSIMAEQRQRHTTVKAELTLLKGQQPQLRDQMNKVKDRIDRLEVADEGGECPLCSQPLSSQHRHSVLAELQTDGQEMGERYRLNKSQIKHLEVEEKQLQTTEKTAAQLEKNERSLRQKTLAGEARLDEIKKACEAWAKGGADRLVELVTVLADETAVSQQNTRVQSLAPAIRTQPQRIKEQQAEQTKLSKTVARLNEIKKLLTDWAESGKNELAACEKRLSQQDFAKEAQTQLAHLEKQEADLAYDRTAHKTAQDEQKRLAQSPKNYQELKEAQAAIKPLDDAINDLKRRLEQQKETLEQQQKERQEAETLLATFSINKGELRAVENDVFQLREEEIAANQAVGGAQQRLDVLGDLRTQRKQLNKDKDVILQRIQRLKLLEKACGRNGVQALLIEQALPEIEDHANELLERLTDGGMRIVFDTQRKLKSRDALAETLDIRIIDNVGERPYANYSGGEQFRVNFAIRLALSQLLARRSGARLQTLVIDEGFGSQDPNGRQRLIEAINTIQDNFKRILIITHIDELRDAFPTRIEISKNLAGSTISVI